MEESFSDHLDCVIKEVRKFTLFLQDDTHMLQQQESTFKKPFSCQRAVSRNPFPNLTAPLVVLFGPKNIRSGHPHPNAVCHMTPRCVSLEQLFHIFLTIIGTVSLLVVLLSAWGQDYSSAQQIYNTAEARLNILRIVNPLPPGLANCTRFLSFFFFLCQTEFKFVPFQPLYCAFRSRITILLLLAFSLSLTETTRLCLLPCSRQASLEFILLSESFCIRY